MSRKARKDPAREAVQLGWAMVGAHPVFRYLRPTIHPAAEGELNPREYARLRNGQIIHHPARRAEPAEWAWVFAHLLLHLGFGHTDAANAGYLDLGQVAESAREWAFRTPEPEYRAACCMAVNRFLQPLKLGRSPEQLPHAWEEGDEAALAARWRSSGIPAEYLPDTPADFVVHKAAKFRKVSFENELAAGLALAAQLALELAGERRIDGERKRKQPWDEALGWFVSSFPLLGALAAGMEIVADAELSHAWDISIAAVDASAGEIYVNPLRRLAQDEWRFVLAHEMLHAALRHGGRAGGREPYLWNCACDYVINGWLVEMGVGSMPEGLLYDPELAGLSAEAVYDQIATDLRRMRKLATLRGHGKADILGEPIRKERRYVDLDEYYRNALSTGLAYHHNAGRGLLPAGLEEEIRALDQPPLPWDAQLARWFDEHVPTLERHRSYARASRRQSSTPDIPRPGWRRPEELIRRVTFGVVLDTSGSMDPALLGKGLGAIASYAAARDVPYARVVFCDAAAYDAGYLPVEQIASKVRVRGRGGTVLQPGINLLERAADFPADGPILVITDAACDVVRVRREHAFLIPGGANLPFRPRGPVFRMT